jgi:hypothetical protein
MKTQWQIYQELELIPDAVSRPKTNLWAHLVKPLRRSLSNSFVRELADRHRIFLFNRCLAIRDVQQVESVPSTILQGAKSVGRARSSTAKAATQSLKLQVFKLPVQQPPNQSNPLW